MTTASLEESRRAKRTRDRNYRFRKLSPPKQRVRIARDVLDRLADGWLEPRAGDYFTPVDKTSWAHVSTDAQVHAALDRQESCRVCAIGAVFTCAVRRANDIRMNSIPSALSYARMDFVKYLKRWFDQPQLDLIEAAFEMSMAQCGTDIAYSDKKHAVNFGKRFNSAYDRMTAIMWNIVDNGGDFVP